MKSLRGNGSASTLRQLATVFRSLATQLTLILGTLTGSAVLSAADWPDDNRLYNIEDAAGMFNERGYARANSFTLDGNEIVNDFNGNLMFTQPLLYLPISENGIYMDFKLTYNGSVGHSAISARSGSNTLIPTPINLPEWILSVNNIAVQTFNFENELIAWETLPDDPSLSEDNEVAALITGYHTCYRETNSNSTGVISILMGDGSLKELYGTSIGISGPPNMKGGEYSTLSKDDADRGYLWAPGDSLYGYFTLFRSDGTRVQFQVSQAEFRTCQTNYGEYEKDHPRMLLPAKFEDQMGHAVGLAYDFTHGSETIYGHPLLNSVGNLSLLWSSWVPGSSYNAVLIRLGSEMLYTISFASRPPDPAASITSSGVSWKGESNRGLVFLIEDSEGRTTRFKYRSYARTFQNMAYSWDDGRFWQLCGGGNREAGNIYELQPWRIWQIQYPEGGFSFFHYFKDPLTAWGQYTYSGPGDVQSIDYDHTENCLDPLLPLFPCKKSIEFDSLGRDPFFQNIVSSIRHTNTDSSVISTDSLIFTWEDNDGDLSIDPGDLFETQRWFGKEDLQLEIEKTGYTYPQIKSRLLWYRYYPEKGPLSSKSRDRGWALKMENSHQQDLNNGGMSFSEKSFWDIECDGAICDGTFQLDSVVTTQGGVSFTRKYAYGWLGDPADEEVTNLIRKDEVDPWGIQSETHYNSDYMTIDGTPECFYSGSLVDSVVFRRDSDGTRLRKEATSYYDGLTSDGYVGQPARAVEYLFDNYGQGLVTDSVVDSVTYYRADAPLPLHRGAIKWTQDPNGNKSSFFCPGLAETTNFKLLAHDGTIESVSDEESFLFAGPFWFRFVRQVGKRTLTWQREIDDRGRLLWLVGPGTFRSEVTYDNLNRVDKLVLPGGFAPSGAQGDTAWSIAYEYDDEFGADPVSVRMKTRVDKELPSQESRVWIDGFSKSYQQDAINGDGSFDSTLTAYDFTGRVISITDQLDHEITSQFDHLDRQVKATYPDPSHSADSVHYSVTTAGAVGLDTLFNFGEDFLLKKRLIDENSNYVLEYYDVRDKLRLRQTITDQNVISTYFDYDDLGNLRLVIKPNGDSVRYLCNSLGQLKVMQSADYKADASEPTYGSIYYEYDKNGNVTATSYPNLNYDRPASDYDWQYSSYDELDRVIETGLKMSSASPGVYDYTPYYRYFYDQSNSQNSIGRLSLSFHFDPNSAANYAECFHYDGRGRVVRQINYFNATLDSIYVSGGDLWEYHADGDTVVLEYSFDWADQLKSLTYPDGSVVSYNYDNRGRLTAIGGEPVEDSTMYAQVSYTQRDQLEQMILGEGLQQVDYAYNERGWLKSINDGTSSDLGAPNDVFGQEIYFYTHPQDPGGVWTPQYNGNLFGQRLSTSGESVAFAYSYDEADRLKYSLRTYPGFGAAEAFDYDANGNAYYTFGWNPTTGAVTEKNLTYEPGTNRLALVDKGELQVDDTLYYDPNGNIVRHSGKQADFFYDVYNRLSSIYVQTELGTDTIWFGYDAAGERIYKKYFYHYRRRCQWESFIPKGEAMPGGMDTRLTKGTGSSDSISLWCTFTDTKHTYYVRGIGKVLAELSSVRPVSYSCKFIYAGNSRIAMRNGSGVLHYYLNDHLGSARVVLDSAGAIRDRHRYFAFGETYWEETNTNQSYHYTSKPLDSEGGLDIYYYGARYYDPELGRFLAIDPLANRYPSWSPYVYTLDNPLRSVDPTGGGVLDVIAGTIVAVVDNALGGGTEARDWYGPTDASDYNLGQDIGDAASFVSGLGLALSGGAAAAGGGVATVGSGGTAAVVGVPAAAGGVGLLVYGAALGGSGIGNLVMQKGRASGGDANSTRSEFNKTRRTYWKEEASNNGSKYSAENLERMKQGKPPLDSQGKPIELHHKKPISQGGTNDKNNIKPMGRSEHREGKNYRLNHPEKE